MFLSVHAATKPRPPGFVDLLKKGVVSQPIPWPNQTWTLLALLYYRQRQVWVVNELKEPVIDAASKQRKRGHRAVGYVAELPEWEYEVTEESLAVTNRVTGEHIIVYLDDYETKRFDESSFEMCVSRENENHTSPVMRFQQLHRTGRTIALTLAELREKGCFLLPQDDDQVTGEQFVDEILDYQQLLGPFLAAWESPDDRLWMAAHIGDWEIVRNEAETIGDNELLKFADAQHEQYQRSRLEKWRPWANPEDSLFPAFGLPALCLMAELDAHDLGNAVQACFRHGDIPAQYASNLVAEGWIDDAKWYPNVMDRLKDVVSQPWNAGDGNKHMATRCAEFLLRHAFQVDEVFAILLDKAEYIPEAALLALEHSGKFFWHLIRKSLRSGRESSYRKAAAILALLGDSRSQRLCLTAMKRSKNPLKVAYCQIALLTMWGQEDVLPVQQAVRHYLSKCKARHAILAFDSSPIKAFGREPDLLAERFKNTVDALADRVLTYRANVLSAYDV